MEQRASTKGFQDHHCHWDRAFTYGREFFEHEGGIDAFIDASLRLKQDTVGIIHRGEAFTEKSLRTRMTRVIRDKIVAGEKMFNGIVDCSPDINGRAFEIALELREQFSHKMEINVGAYPIFGFKDRGSDRQKHLEKLARKAQFLVGLPERDARQGHSVGFDGHLAMLLEMALTYNIPLQVHVDQTNTPEESGTERLIEATRWIITNRFLPTGKRPKVWAVHVISPSCYSEERFRCLVKGLQETDIGVIVCPHAALSMRQMRNRTAPLHNSIARVRELLLAGIDIRLGTDNIRDLMVPIPKSALLEREIEVLASALRYYDESVLYKIARGEPLNQTDKASVERSLRGDYEAFGWPHFVSD